MKKVFPESFIRHNVKRIFPIKDFLFHEKGIFDGEEKARRRNQQKKGERRKKKVAEFAEDYLPCMSRLQIA